MKQINATSKHAIDYTYALVTLGWSRWITLCLAILQLLAGFIGAVWELQFAACIHFYFVFLCSVAIFLLEHRRLYSAAIAIIIGVLAGGVCVIMVLPQTLMVVLVYPVMLAAGIAPYVSRQTLQIFSVSTLLLLLAIVAPMILLPLQSGTDLLIQGANLLSIFAVVGITLALIWHSQNWMAAKNTQARVANQELQATQASLESQVSTRSNELARAAALLRATLESTAEGIAVSDNQRMITWNQRFIDMWQLPITLVPGRDDLRMLEHIQNQLVEPQVFLDVARHALKSGKPVFDVVVCKDGRVFERYSRPRIIDGFDSNRVWCYREITQQARVEQRIRALAMLGQRLSAATSIEEATRTTIEVADTLFSWDACYFDVYNQAEDTLESIVCIDTIDGKRVEMPGSGATPIGPIEQKIMHDEPLLMLRHTSTFTDHGLQPFGDVERLSESLMFVPIRRNQTIIGVFSIQSYTPNAYTRDDLQTLQALADHCGGAFKRILTESALREAEEKRQALERKMLETQKLESLGVLAGGIAHDFNNLLAIVLGNVHLAQFDLEPDHPALESVRQIEVATRRATELTRQMLAYAGKSQAQFTLVDLNHMVAEMQSLLAASVPKHVDMRHDLLPALPAVLGDPTQLRQVLMNLMVNAAEALPEESGSLVVRTRITSISRADLVAAVVGGDIAEGHYVTVEVSDNGCGMDEPTLRKIFDPFFSTKFTGRGLGLAAVLGIARSHKGAIIVQSTLHVGTTFRLFLPIANEDDNEHASGRYQPEWKGSGEIVVIDDDPEVRETITRMVTHLGFTPQPFAEGRAAVAYIAEHESTTAAILLDMVMPEMDGKTVVHKLHECSSTAPIVIMSGYTQKSAEAMMKQAHVVGFLHKPFDVQQLHAILQTSARQVSPMLNNNEQRKAAQ